ncbi:MAG: hypothetical protein Q9212_006691 [Teloschistes hypoglaucus]
MSRGGGTTLYVTGFGHGTRARDLAYEFERSEECFKPTVSAQINRSIIQDQAEPYNSFAFVEYESRRDADDAYHEMHNKRLGRDDLLKIEWARTPPSASWRFDSGSDRRPPPGRRDRSPRRGRSGTPPRRRDYSPRKDDRRERDYDRRDRDRSRSPEDRDREMKDVRDRRDDEDDREPNGEDRKGTQFPTLINSRKLTKNCLTVSLDSPVPAHDELDTAE